MVLLCSGDDASAGNGKTIGDLLKVCYGILIHHWLIRGIFWRIENHDSEDQERLASCKEIQLVVSMVLDRCQSTITPVQERLHQPHRIAAPSLVLCHP